MKNTVVQLASDLAAKQKIHLAAQDFARDGAAMLQQVVDPALIDRVRHLLQSIDEQSPFVGVIKGRVVTPSRENQQHHRFRFKDVYINHRETMEAVLAPLLVDLLNEITGEPVLAFQSLGFIRGTGLRLHRDSNFVAVDRHPERVIGTWLALEDIEEGMGELVYYPGSHRFPAYEMSEGSLHRRKLPGKYHSNDDYVEYLANNIAANRLEKKQFLARKGDVLVWHADLVHAGSPVTIPGASRYSMATHFCPLSVTPHYFTFFRNAAVVRHTDKVSFSSVHHNLNGVIDSTQLHGCVIKPNIPSIATL